MSIKPGTRYWSTTSSTAIVVVRAPSAEVALTCDGAPLADTEQPAQGGTPKSEADGGTLLGKRYTDADSGLEVLCTRGGEGVLAVDGRPLTVAGARALPASD
ncbi:hypothetical protein [Prauserella flavalba]|uniref:Uncharacterized protein n=1 Tax=Prauserella flavalba TaxID=1477506 RepID=A0A318LLW6_9PSEU|nr:hypothetical protein [Prauserella flavalba]PXY35341.1 hypothetical protein BA062_07265 [Prauserella flavalba]